MSEVLVGKNPFRLMEVWNIMGVVAETRWKILLDEKKVKSIVPRSGKRLQAELKKKGWEFYEDESGRRYKVRKLRPDSDELDIQGLTAEEKRKFFH